MKVRCELIDYTNNFKSYSEPRVIVSDADFDRTMVKITVHNDITVKVSAKDLIAAINNCTNLPY